MDGIVLKYLLHPTDVLAVATATTLRAAYRVVHGRVGRRVGGACGLCRSLVVWLGETGALGQVSLLRDYLPYVYRGREQRGLLAGRRKVW